MYIYCKIIVNYLLVNKDVLVSNKTSFIKDIIATKQDLKLVEAPSNFIAGRPKAALLVRFLIVVLLSMCLLSASILATCVAAHFAPCCAL